MIWTKTALFGALLLVCSINALNLGEYFRYDRETQLKNGEEESIFIKLAAPVHFFSETYDNIYVSTARFICERKRVQIEGETHLN